jgi:hypothetical protein
MERFFEEQFKDIQTRAPKDLVREYDTPEGGILFILNLYIGQNNAK